MRKTRFIMGMPVVLEIAQEGSGLESDMEEVFQFLTGVDQRFSTYKQNSEITKINNGQIKKSKYSPEMRQIFELAIQTKAETKGYFDIGGVGKCDPSGIVKGWAINESAKLLDKKGYKNFYVEIAGDIELRGLDGSGKAWTVGIRNPFNSAEIVKVLSLSNCGVATSGNYARGKHIYNPKNDNILADDIASITIIGPNIYEADRFATAAFAMGSAGIVFIENRPSLEGYMINKEGIATMTSKFKEHVTTN